MRNALCLVVGLLLPCLTGTASHAGDLDLPLSAEALPPGWEIPSQVRRADETVPAYEEKNGGKVAWMATQYVDVHGRSHQMHTVLAATEDDAKAIAAVRAKGHGGDFVRRKDLYVLEVVGGDRDFAARMWALLGVEEKTARWRCDFSLACVDAYTDAAALEEVEGLFSKLAFERNDEVLKTSITTLVADWTFGSQLAIPTNAWRLRPGPREEVAEGRFTRYTFGELPDRCTVPYVEVDGVLQTEARYVPVPGEATDAQRAATRRWPADDAEVVDAARKVVGDATGPRDKVLAILRSLGKPPRASSRERCDRFITLCRASGIAARLVGGWRPDLRKPRVWAEVHLTGEGWIPVDPATVWLGISTRYMTLQVSEDGVLRLLHVELPRARRVSE